MHNNAVRIDAAGAGSDRDDESQIQQASRWLSGGFVRPRAQSVLVAPSSTLLPGDGSSSKYAIGSNSLNLLSPLTQGWEGVSAAGPGMRGSGDGREHGIGPRQR